MNSKFRVSPYELNAQRHIYPLYITDNRGGYEFSSTMTFVKSKGNNFCIFAAHAIHPKTDGIEQIGVFTTDGKFMPISTVSINHKVCRKRDLVACLTSGPFESKHYFDLDSIESSTEFMKDFGWIGFPKKKAVEKIHHTKATKEKIQGYLTEGDDGLKKWTNANFLLLGVKLESESETEITGVYINKNTKYTHEGFKSNGYSLKGMSGGALFRGPKKLNNPQSLSDIFQFAGIGLEYQNNRLVKGASRRAVETLIEEVVG